MQIYNTEHGQKEEFIPTHKDKVSMYVCGITTYDYAHIGHARSAITFDTWLRLLRYKGYDVCFIRNFTDIDDKIIARAQKENRDWQAISKQFIDAYHEDMDLLYILRPTVEPKATEHIQDMIDCIQELIEKGYAYTTSEGDVYYRVRKCKDYGVLSGHSIDSLYNNVRIEASSNKEDALDFALWKSAKEGEPYWESPWGKGRPGWHIECSAMSKKYAPLPIDIHGGGRDLIFPHHENEKAQTESICDCSFVKYWVHNGFVQINSEKMSKSLNNFTTIRDILQEYLPEVLRYFLLTKHYRSPIDFSLESMRDAEKNLRTIYTARLLAEEYIASYKGTIVSNMESPYIQEYITTKEEIISCMEDDCNTACALGHLFTLVHSVYRVLKEQKKNDIGFTIATFFINDIQLFSQLLGLFSQEPESFLQALRHSIAQRHGIDEHVIEQRIEERTRARKAKDFTLADTIREELALQGISLQDNATGTTWDFE